MATQVPTDATQDRGRDYRYLLTAVGTALPAVLLVWLLVLYLHNVPAMKKVADEYGLTLSQRTQSVIRTSLWLADNWWWTVLCLVPLAAANVVLIRLLGVAGRRFGRAGTWILPIVWVAAASLALTVVAVRTSNAVDEPLDWLRDRLKELKDASSP